MMSTLSMAGPRLDNLTLYDRWLCLASLAIVILGLIMVTSASIVISEQQYGYPFHYAIRQLLSFGLGVVAMIMVLKTPMILWERISGLLLILSFVLLILVLIPGIGHTVNGARRWIGAGPLRVQVAELVKLWMIIYLAGYLVRHSSAVQNTLQGFLKPIILLTGISGLLLLQPDFGSAVVILATALGMLFLGGCRLIPLTVLFGTSLSGFALLALTSPYRLRRLTAFMDPWIDQFDSGYQLTQSLIAFGRGGWFGQGLGESVQKLFYLPEAHTDFLFAVLAEELGFLGMITVIILFSLLVYRGVTISHHCWQAKQPFAAHVSIGISLWLGLQTIVNLGVNTGLLPTKGLTLPLMSYGGASLIVAMIAIAMLIRIDFEARRELMGLTPPRAIRRKKA